MSTNSVTVAQYCRKIFQEKSFNNFCELMKAAPTTSTVASSVEIPVSQ
ncbi:MAG: hypothetical protein AB8B66_05905 [Rickettsiaceae bacterium]